MRVLQFCGHSDDVFAILGTGQDEPQEVGCYNSHGIVKIETPAGEGVCVTGYYAPNNKVGCWTIGLMPMDDDLTIPDWWIGFDLALNGFSPLLTIHAPDDAEVSAM